MKLAKAIFTAITLMIYCAAISQNLMPDGFERIVIGMSWRDLVKIRPQAKILNLMPDPTEELKPDPDRPGRSLTEELKGSRFNRVVYTFSDGILCSIIFGKRVISHDQKNKFGLIKEIAVFKGKPSKIQVREKNNSQGVVTWKDKEILVNVFVQLNTDASSNRVIGYQIMTINYAKSINAIGLGYKSESDTPSTALNRAVLVSFQTEINGLLNQIN